MVRGERGTASFGLIAHHQAGAPLRQAQFKIGHQLATGHRPMGPLAVLVAELDCVAPGRGQAAQPCLQDRIRTLAAPKGEHDAGIEIGPMQLPGDQGVVADRGAGERIEVAVPELLVLLDLGQRGPGFGDGKLLVQIIELGDGATRGGAA